MNPQYPFPNSFFPPYNNPLNPNPNPNPNPQFNLIRTSQQTLIPDLPSSLSSLQTLLNLSKSTLESFSSLVPPLSSSSSSLAQCPSNPHHWVPPSALFRHSLNCPSPIEVGPILDNLRYPRTLKTEQQLIEQNKFVQPLHDPNAELCFSLDDYVDFESNFFYQHCPGVVGLSDRGDASQGRIFTLPGVLSVECANFVGNGDRETDGVQGNSVKALPSEIWVVRREVEQCRDYPNAYSYSVLKALLCLESEMECDLSVWLIVNSPRFGVTIDVSMRDHMLVLFKLCLKAMFREAVHSYKPSFSIKVGDNGGLFNPKLLSFKCPVLVEVLRWLSMQLSNLYGEANSKSYIISMLGYLLPKVLSRASIFPLERAIDQTFVIDDQNNDSTRQPSAEVVDNGVERKEDERMFSKPLFVYQIAAAIAAVHERSLLEARIKALRMPLPLTPYQRSIEHAHLSKKADEERQKRPDYRSLIEHDGLLSHRQRDKGNTAKTREEILAEERDYKRRRMSYRGKKLKRSTKEVMRDIIEDYMETITRAGGIGCLTMGDEGASATFKTSPAHDLTNFMPNRSMRNDQQDAHGKVAQNNQGFQDTKHTDASSSGYDRHRKDNHNHGRFEDWGPSTDKNQSGYYSRSPSRDDRYERSKERRSHRRNHDITEMDIDEHSKRNRSSNTTRHNENELQHSRSSSLSISSGRKDRKKLYSLDRHRHREDYVRRDDFNDRYDPSKSFDDNDDQYDN